MSLTILTPAQAKALAKIAIKEIEFSTKWSSGSSFPGDAVDYWNLTAYIPTELLREYGTLNDKDYEQNLFADIGDRVVLAKASGFIIWPHVVNDRYDWCTTPIHSAYDEPDDVPRDIYETLYTTDADEVVLREDVIEAMGEDPGLYDNVVPTQHCHISEIEFAPGFATIEDLAFVVDSIAQRYGSGFVTPFQGLLTMDVEFNEAMSQETGHDMMRFFEIVDTLGFELVDDVLVHASMCSQEDAQKRLKAYDARRLKRTPI